MYVVDIKSRMKPEVEEHFFVVKRGLDEAVAVFKRGDEALLRHLLRLRLRRAHLLAIAGAFRLAQIGCVRLYRDR